MEYLFLFSFQVLGILSSVTQKVYALDKQYPEKKFNEIYGLFFENEWSSLSISVVVLFIDLLFHGVLDVYFPAAKEAMITIPLTEISLPFIVVSFIVALVLGYGGQRIAYKYLGKAEQYLTSKAE